MPEPATCLLDRLRHGRGDAVRELLRMPRDQASEVLLDCLCTADIGAWLTTHCEGYVELLLALQPPLDRWYAHIAALPADCDEELVAFPMRMLHDAAVRGSTACYAFLLEQVRNGNHWRHALDEFHLDELSLSEDLWHELLPRMSPEDLRLFVNDRADWQARARRWPNVANALELHRAHRASFLWSMRSYEAAHGSPKRWQVLADGLALAPDPVAPLLVEGLWDASVYYRSHCMQLVELDLPSVRERLAQLAQSAPPHIAQLAKQRLAAPSCGSLPAT